MNPGDRLVCAFISPKLEGEIFKEWPLHATIVPWFRSDINTQELTSQFQTDLKVVGPFLVEMGESTHFGHNKNKKVNLVRLPSSFFTVEKLVRRAIKVNGAWIVDESTKRHRSFTLHVTAQKNACLMEGDTFKCDRIYIIEQLGNEKKINAVVELSDE